ncbi:MAG: hypothetical protein LBM98_02365, partial [Oscillospiraceae bacterium]|nr:hypothetical protein [Oscillospiraceae bacterium]
GGVDEDGKPIQKHYEQSLRQMQTMMVEHIPEQINMFTKMPIEEARKLPRYVAAMARLHEGEPG